MIFLKKNFRDRLITSFFLILMILLILRSNFVLNYCLILFGTLSVIEFINLSNKLYKNILLKCFFNFLFITYVFLFCYIFFFFSNFAQLKMILFFILFGCIASDIGGFTCGKLIKGPKLTKISPKKTVAGAIGSLIFSSIVLSSIVFYFNKTISLNIILIGLATSLACQIGDLFFSFLKRKAKIKDTGNILPGHGGILDRLDGIFFGLPIGFFIFVLLF